MNVPNTHAHPADDVTTTRRPWLFGLVMAGVVLSAFLSMARPHPASVPRVAGVSAQIQTPFLVEVSDGFESRVLPWNAGPIRKNDGTPAANLRFINTVTRPDSSTVVFEQRTDSGGLIRGQLYASILGQTGTYTLKVQVAGGGPFVTDSFTLTTPVDLSGDNTFQGNVDVQGDLTGTTASFSGSLTAASLAGDGSGLTALAAGNVTSGTLADARLSSNVALKDAANTFIQSQTISNAGGKTTFQLSNTGSDTGLTIGGDANLYRSAADELKTDDTFDAAAYKVAGAAGATDSCAAGQSRTGAAYSGGILTTAGSCTTVDSSGWTDDGTTVRLSTSTDSVGIGTATASGKLTVHDSVAAGVAKFDFVNNTAADTANKVRLRLAPSSGFIGLESFAPSVDSYVEDSANGKSGISFRTYNGAGGVGERLKISGVGQVSLPVNGSTGGLVIGSDTNLYRSAVDLLTTDDNFQVATGGDDPGEGTGTYLENSGKINSVRSGVGTAFGTSITGDTQLRLGITSQGVLQWSDGSAAADTNLYRGAANTLQSDDTVAAAGFKGTGATLPIGTSAGNFVLQVTGGGSTSTLEAVSNDLVLGTFRVDASHADIVFQGTNSGGTTQWAKIDAPAGQLQLPVTGSGAGILVGGDANLYRNAANVLKTDDAFVASVASTAAGSFDRKTTDGTIVSLQQDGTEEGTISVAGNTVSYNAFTGSHYARTDGTLKNGLLVSMTGENGRLGGRRGSEIVYGAEKTAKANDPAVLGSYLSVLEPQSQESNTNPSLVTAVGNGEAWVVDNGRNLRPGDALISSDTAGHAMRDPGTYAVSHVVARAAEPVDWSTVKETVDGKKRQKVSVLFDAYDRERSNGPRTPGGASTKSLVAVAVLTALGMQGLALLGRTVRRRRA